MSTIQIHVTTDYGQFKNLHGNRQINIRHVRELSKSIDKNNLLQYAPILVTKDLQVIDGQHRLAAAKHLRISIPYTIVPDAKLQTVQMLNSNLRAWSLRDFCESFSKLGNAHYQELLEFSEEYGCPLTTAASLLSGRKNIDEGSKVGAILKAGIFEVKARNNAHEMMKRLSELKPFCIKNTWIHRSFIHALFTLFAKGMKYELLQEQLASQGKKIYRQAAPRDYMIALLDIYNHGMRKNRLDIL